MPDQRLPYIRIWLDGELMPDVEGKVRSLEVDERADDASSFHMVLNMAPGQGDWDALADGRFTLLRRVTIGFGLGSPDASGAAQRAIVIDGYVTAVEPHFAEQRVPDSALELYGLDASCLMHLEERTRRFAGMADSEVARQVFGEYGFQVSGDTIEPTAKRSENRSVIMQRRTDSDLLRMLARRNGFEVYVEPSQQDLKAGGDAAAQCVAHFHRARPDRPPQPKLWLTPHATPTIEQLTARWESHRPAVLRGEHIDEQTRRIRSVEVAEPRFPRMGKVGRGELLKQRLAAILPRRPETRAIGLQHVDVPHDPAETDNLAWSDFVAADWLVEAQAVIRAASYPQILRARRPVPIGGAGKLLDGTWYVKTARHCWTWDTEDNRYRVEAELVRDALDGVG
jgi:hypothetical protein